MIKQPYRFFLVFTITIIPSIGYRYDFPKEQVNLLLSTIILSLTLLNQFLLKRKQKSTQVFVLKSNNWIWSIIPTIFLVFVYSYAPLNYLNILAIGIAVVAGFLGLIHERTIKYSIESDGICNLRTGKLITSDIITGINCDTNELTITSTRSLNELTIKSSRLLFPTWDVLTTELKKYSG